MKTDSSIHDKPDTHPAGWFQRFRRLWVFGLVLALLGLLIFVFYSRDALQVTAEISARAQAFEYKLPVNRPVRFELPAGIYKWSSASLEEGGEHSYQVAQSHELSVNVTRSCADCAAQEVVLKQTITPHGILKMVWEVSQSGVDAPKFDFVDSGRTITSPIQVGYQSSKQISNIRSTHFGSALQVGEYIGASTINAASSHEVPLLLSGTVRFYGRALTGDTRFAIKQGSLREGDIVEVRQGYGPEPPEVWMQVNFTSREDLPDAFDIIARTAASRVHIAQNQAAPGFDVGVTWTDQIVNEPTMLVIYGVLVLLSVVFASVPVAALRPGRIRKTTEGEAI